MKKKTAPDIQGEPGAHAPEEKWEDEKERRDAYADLFEFATSDFAKFKADVLGQLQTNNMCPPADSCEERFVVVRAPYYAHETEALSPFDAVRNAIEFEFDGGSAWNVWDRRTGIGYYIKPNAYIYQPMAEAVEEMSEAARHHGSAADPDPDKRFWIDSDPSEKPFGEHTIGVVDEELGGIFAYFNNLVAADEYCSTLNAEREP